MRIPESIILLLMALAVGLASTPRPARGHDPYSDWKQPKTGISCCHNRDCRPTRAYMHDDGRWRALLNGRWVAIPRALVLDRVAPDGGSHICADQTGTILCFVGGVPKS